MATFTSHDGTLLGPMSTAWSPPPDCLVHIVNCATCDEGFRGQTCTIDDEGVGRARDFTGCWPPATRGAGTPAYPFVGWGFYSPGTACPTGYQEACTARYGMRAEWDVQFLLIEGETAIGCCPEGYSCTNRNGNTCIQIASTDATVRTGSCSGTDIGFQGTATLPDSVTATTTVSDNEVVTTTIDREMTLLAPMFQINYQSSDLSSTSTFSEASRPPPATESATGTSITESGSPPGQDNNESAPSTEADSTLSAGAIAGASVGAVAGLLLLILAAWFWWRRKSQQRDSIVTGSTPWKTNTAVEGYEAPKDSNIHQPAELASETHHIVAELQAHPTPNHQQPTIT